MCVCEVCYKWRRGQVTIPSRWPLRFDCIKTQHTHTHTHPDLFRWHHPPAQSPPVVSVASGWWRSEPCAAGWSRPRCGTQSPRLCEEDHRHTAYSYIYVHTHRAKQTVNQAEHAQFIGKAFREFGYVFLCVCVFQMVGVHVCVCSVCECVCVCACTSISKDTHKKSLILVDDDIMSM